MTKKLKYIKTSQNEIIVFSELLNHSDFRRFSPISAGFCYIEEDKVKCFGKSVSLGIASEPEADSLHATRQFINEY